MPTEPPVTDTEGDHDWRQARHDLAAQPVGSASLRCVDVTVRRGGRAILDRVSIDIPVGRCALIGPNGAGKTTLLQLLHGLVPPDAGSVQRPHGVRVALVFQHPVMLRRSVRANVEHALAVAGIPAAQRRVRADAALAALGLSALGGQPAPGLSGGERQRLAIARAEALSPVRLLLDEPTASLDPAAGLALERHLLALADHGRHIMLSTHDIGFARRFAQTVVFMHRGRILETTDAAVFFERPSSPEARRFLDGVWLD